MKAGRELDKLVAEHVMGFRWMANAVERSDSYCGTRIFYIGEAFLVPPNEANYGIREHTWEEVTADTKEADRSDYFVPRYSTNIADAWLVVERLLTLSPKLKIEYNQHIYGWVVASGDTGRSCGRTFPLAICEEALCLWKVGDL